jgi:hypothetical protein
MVLPLFILADCGSTTVALVDDDDTPVQLSINGSFVTLSVFKSVVVLESKWSRLDANDSDQRTSDAKVDIYSTVLPGYGGAGDHGRHHTPLPCKD